MNCAVIASGNSVSKITNLKRKYNKLKNNPDITILEECDSEHLQEKYEYWKRLYDLENQQKIEQEHEEAMKYHFRNPKTGYTYTSIYPYVDKQVKDWQDYERID